MTPADPHAHGDVGRLAQSAFAAFDEATELAPGVVVTPSVPILFFGNVARYRQSALRAVTVGLNPSLEEFPPSDPFLRFRPASGLRSLESSHERDRYLDALSGYFADRPYASWFGRYEPLLDGLETSFYDGRPNTALHTDICSPVATSPTWSRLPVLTRSALIQRGRPLWHDLMRLLRPHVLLVSVARKHLEAISLEPVSEWSVVYRVERKNPYIVRVRRFALSEGVTTTLVFGNAAQNPFGLIGSSDKRLVGEAVKKLLDG